MNIWPRQNRLQRDRRRAFTLAELLVVIAIIGLVASMTLFGLQGAREDARERRARAQITKIHELIVRQWESYRTRAVPVDTKIAGSNLVQANRLRLYALRQLMRMELPDRKTDLMAEAQALETRPSLALTYIRRARQQIIGKYDLPPNSPDSQDAWMDDNTWTPEHQQAECFYLILSSIRDGGTTGLDFFTEDEIGDADGDGMPEILDPWGVPIYFLRWAPGFRSDIQPGDIGTTDGDAGEGNGDPFDPLKVDPRWQDGEPDNDPFVLYPLIVSAGRDGDFGMLFNLSISFDPSSSTYQYDDPYFSDPSTGNQLGAATGPGSADNITSHFVEVR